MHRSLEQAGALAQLLLEFELVPEVHMEALKELGVEQVSVTINKYLTKRRREGLMHAMLSAQSPHT